MKDEGKGGHGAYPKARGMVEAGRMVGTIIFSRDGQPARELEQCFTINGLGVLSSLHCYLAATNIIESPHAGVSIRTRRVYHWQNGAMVRR